MAKPIIKEIAQVENPYRIVKQAAEDESEKYSSETSQIE